MASGSERRLRTGGSQNTTPRPFHAAAALLESYPKFSSVAGPSGTPGGPRGTPGGPRPLRAPVRPTGSPSPRTPLATTRTPTSTPVVHSPAANNLKPVELRYPKTPSTPSTPSVRPNGLSPAPASSLWPHVAAATTDHKFQGFRVPQPPAQPSRAPTEENRPTVARPSPHGTAAGGNVALGPKTTGTPRHADSEMSAPAPRTPLKSKPAAGLGKDLAGGAGGPGSPGLQKAVTPRAPEPDKAAISRANGPGKIELPKVFEPGKTETSREPGPGKVELPKVFQLGKKKTPRDSGPGKIELPKVFELKKSETSRDPKPVKIETPHVFRPGHIETPSDHEPGKIELPNVFEPSKNVTSGDPGPGKIELPKVFGPGKAETASGLEPGKIETPKAFRPSKTDALSPTAPGKIETPNMFRPNIAETPRALAAGRGVPRTTPTQATPGPGPAGKPDILTPKPQATATPGPATAPENGAARPTEAAAAPNKLSWLWTRPAGLPEQAESEEVHDGIPAESPTESPRAKDAPESREDGASVTGASVTGECGAEEFDSLLSPSLPSSSPSASSLRSLLGSWPGGRAPDPEGNADGDSNRDKDSNRDSGVETQGLPGSPGCGVQPEPPNSPEPMASAAQKLHLTAMELLETERTYVKRLSLLDEVFHKQLREEAEKGSFSVDVVSQIFSNLPSIHSFHRDFLLPELEQRMQEWDTNPRIGDILQKLAPFLKMYGVYVKNFDDAHKLVSTWTTQSSRFADIVLDIQRQAECMNLTLQNHMLGPVQRIPRYQLLLQDYLKRLAPGAPDRPDAEKSLDLIATAATHSNSAIRRNEHMQALLRVHEMLGGEVTDIVCPDTELLKEGIILKRSVRIGVPQERYLFLFNTMLLHCVPKLWSMGQRYSLRTRINVRDLEVKDVNQHDQVPTFQVCGVQRTIDFQARTEKEKQEWMKAINEVIKTFREKEETFMGHKKDVVEGPSVSSPPATQGLELGQRAPMWVRDVNVTLCMACQDPFTALTRRRHHCRACGKVVCFKCSDHRVLLAYEPRKLQRVCWTCYAQLTEEARTSTAAIKNRNILQKQSAEEATRESIICGSLHFLECGGRQSWARVWCVIPRSDPLVLYVYAAPQDVRALKTLPLPGYEVRSPAAGDGVDGRRALVLAQSQRRLGLAADTDALLLSWRRALEQAALGQVPGVDEDDSFSDDDDSDGPEAGPDGAD
ncbi:FYVE, RhoGEF and PH domain-containing protein 4-like [Lethenteron reissneri]|uniref:FYVE, RhoGEF and PH domain-containing protein 4-like n=1 Tax=Lethenteron reissneri TaxID=7753 RepID=UPI002AB7525E|nr:FYVE, RhoGEF and PH domain-containing protein 4-like [Lethenteron reissneri]